jgi:hypothetical protein
MLSHKEKGQQVFVLRCLGEIEYCISNPESKQKKCQKCIRRFNRGINKIKLGRNNIIKLPAKSFSKQIPEKFNNIEELKRFKIDHANIGMGVASSLISISHDYKFDTIEHKDQTNKLLQTALYIYRASLEILNNIKPNLVYIFNGRFSELHAAIKACEKLSIPYITHDRGANIYKYSLFDNCLPHNHNNLNRQIESCWRKSDNNKYKIGEKWFSDRRAGVDQAWPSHLKNQISFLMPSSFDKTKQNIAIFNSSLDEFEAIPGWENQIYDNEIKALNKIFEDFKGEEDYHFYLRIHPNLGTNKNRQLREIEDIQKKNYKNVDFIWPDDPIDTYSLIDNCDKSLVFGSTVGVEACFWDKPSILAGRAFYENLDCAYIAKSHDNLIELIKADLKPKDKKGAIKYGLWESSRGIPFKYYKPDGFFEGKFLGKNLKFSKGEKFQKQLKAIKKYLKKLNPKKE